MNLRKKWSEALQKHPGTPGAASLSTPQKIAQMELWEKEEALAAVVPHVAQEKPRKTRSKKP